MKFAMRCSVLGPVLAISAVAACPTLCLAQPSFFGSAPDWVGPGYITHDLALGDVDGDGDLDLVRADDQYGAKLHLNQGGVIGLMPAWSSSAPDSPRTVSPASVALGDVDGDGDLDLVCGDWRGVSLYLNNNGMFASVAAWTIPLKWVSHLVLADINGDGNLDLICASSPPRSPGYDPGSMVYLNEGGTFSSVPAWKGPAQSTTSLAVDDVNGDGAPDIVLVISSADAENLAPQSSELYLNQGGVFASAPAWTGPGSWGLALSDVNSDGLPDLVESGLGYLDGHSALYLNQGGVFAPAPAWTGPAGGPLVLGDVDGDGRADLVLADAARGVNTLYLNQGGMLASTPAWTGQMDDHPEILALGDMDGDGDLDLVEGGGILGSAYGSAAYLNQSGPLASVPDWTGPPQTTYHVVLGDVDGDGDLDLVSCGSTATILYLNQDSAFVAASWTGPPALSAALGDVDGDGYPDLVLGGDYGVGPKLYLSSRWGNVFSSEPAWTGPAENAQTWSIALADVNGDGHLDLITGGFPADMTHPVGSQLFLNEGGVFASTPAWTGPETATNDDIAIADVDNDGDMDLVIAWWGQTPMLYLNEGGTFQSEPAWVGPYHNTAPSGIALGDVNGDGYVDLVHGNSLYMNQAGSFAYVPAWTGPQPSGGSVALADMNGDGRLDLFQTYSYQGSMVFINHGGVFASSPAWTSSDSPASTVALGDVNGDGLVDAFESHAEMENSSTEGPTLYLGRNPAKVDGVPQITHVLAGAEASDKYRVRFTTFSPKSRPVWIAGEYQFEGEPKWNPMDFDGGRRLRTGPWPPPVGNFIWDTSHIPDDPRSVVIRLHSITMPRISGQPQFVPSYRLAVGPLNKSIASMAQTDSHGEIPAGSETRVSVSLPGWIPFRQGQLFYKTGGSAGYGSAPLQMTEVVPGTFAPTATIPASIVGPRGVQYWIRVGTPSGELTDPPRNPATQPRSLRAKVADIEEPGEHAGNRYHMVSIPLDLDLPVSSSLASIISDEPAFGPPDQEKWRAFAYSPDESRYLEVGAADSSNAAGRLRPQPGRAFWIISRNPHRIDTAPVPGHSVPTDSAYAITLEPDWNQIADPFDFPVRWLDVTWSGMPNGVEPPVGWDEARQQYSAGDVTVLQPFDGYWVRNTTGRPVTLHVAPREWVEPVSAGQVAKEDRVAAPGRDWSVQIMASTASASDARNYAGVDASARDGEDALDRSDPPVAPGQGVSLYFLPTSSEPDAGHNLWTIDMKSSLGASEDPALKGRQWIFDVALTGGDAQPQDVSVTFNGLDRVPADLEVQLVDHTLERTIDLRKQISYSYVSTSMRALDRAADARFELLIGTPEWLKSRHTGSTDLPPATRLMANRPNPFSPGTVIRFETARPGPVAISVFDVAGRLVRKLTDDEEAAGQHEILWRGDDNDGRPVSSGVYIVRLATPGTAATQKLVRVGSR